VVHAQSALYVQTRPYSGGAFAGGVSKQLPPMHDSPAAQSTSVRHSATHWLERHTSGAEQSEL
jgi:hypothetical protein